MFAYGYKEGLSQAGNATSVRLREICSPSLPTCLTAESAPSHNSPDKNAGASHDKFQAIQGAYEVLADADQREAYDRYGLSGDEDESNWEDADVDIHEFFAQMFGGPSGFGSADPPPYYGARAGPSNGAAKPKKSKGDDQVVDYSVSLEDCYMGKEPEQHPGDLILNLRVRPHGSFSLARKKDDLYTAIILTLSEALLGFSRLLLVHLDGRGLRVTQPKPAHPGYRVFSTGDVVRIKGEGFPKRKSEVKGDLFLRITVEMPTKDEMESLGTPGYTGLEACLPSKRQDMLNPAMTADVELLAVVLVIRTEPRTQWRKGHKTDTTDFSDDEPDY
ncbi:MAG: hypothetical protein CYPHOPRED_004902 [Cyphobasidiales sp. Tagirdzhanova-0007]|nr:MAG: hypothetical protein CYPHOPRED_004902 [Cyphobasidiales sp. Tagirdzhanova-0007]